MAKEKSSSRKTARTPSRKAPKRAVKKTVRQTKVAKKSQGATPVKKAAGRPTPIVRARKMGFLGYIRAGVEIVKLNERVAVGVSKDRNAFWPGVGIVAISGLAVSVGMMNPWVAFAFVPLAILGSFLNVAIIHLFALLLGGNASYGEYYRARACANVIAWPLVIPIFGMIISLFIGIWDVVVNVVTLRAVHGLSTGRAVASILIPFCLIIGLSLLVALVFGTLLGGLMMGTMMG